MLRLLAFALVLVAAPAGAQERPHVRALVVHAGERPDFATANALTRPPVERALQRCAGAARRARPHDSIDLEVQVREDGTTTVVVPEVPTEDWDLATRERRPVPAARVRPWYRCAARALRGLRLPRGAPARMTVRVWWFVPCREGECGLIGTLRE